jgi:hypothetical protein
MEMLYALVLVCSMANTPEYANCDMTSALYYERAPQGAMLPLGCLKLGEAYYAEEIEPRRPTKENEYHRVVCSRSSFRGRVG